MAHSAVFRVREKATLRSAFKVPENGCSVLRQVADSTVDGRLDCLSIVFSFDEPAVDEPRACADKATR